MQNSFHKILLGLMQIAESGAFEGIIYSMISFLNKQTNYKIIIFISFFCIEDRLSRIILSTILLQYIKYSYLKCVNSALFVLKNHLQFGIGNGCQNLENINFSTNPYHRSIRSSIWNVSNSFILLCWASFIWIETFLSNGWPWHLCCQNKTGQLKTFALRTFIANTQNET